METLDSFCRVSAGIIAGAARDDENWRTFGFRGRPRRGSLFQGFVSAKKKELETVVLREMWGATFGMIFWWAAHVAVDFRYRMVFIAKLIEYCVDGLGGSGSIWTVMKFNTRTDGIQFHYQAAYDYALVEGHLDESGNILGEYSKVMMTRFRQSLGEDIRPTWIVAIPTFFLTNTVFGAMIDPEEADTLENDVEIDDSRFIDLSEELFCEVAS